MLFLFYIILHVSNLAFGQKNDEIKRFIKDDRFKMPIFGSYIYDPIKQHFEGVNAPSTYPINNGTATGNTGRPTTTSKTTPKEPVVKDSRTMPPYRKHVRASEVEVSGQSKPDSPVTIEHHSRHRLRYIEDHAKSTIKENNRKNSINTSNDSVTRGLRKEMNLL